MTQGIITKAMGLLQSTGGTKEISKVSRQGKNFEFVMNRNRYQDKPADTKDVVTSKSTNYSKTKESVVKTTDDTTTEPNKNTISQEELDGMKEKVTKIVKDALGISDQELEDMLSQMGIQIMDLFQVDHLKAFIMKANGSTDITDLLTNENISNQFTQLMDAMNQFDLKSQFGITKEELIEVMEKNAELSQISQEDEIQLQTSNLMIHEQELTQETNLNQSDLSQDSDAKDLLDDQIGSASSNLNKDVPILVTSEKSMDTSQQDMDQSNSNGDDINPLDNFVQSLADASTQKVNGFEIENQNVQQIREIVTQVVEQIKILIKPESTSMEIQLNPENLGKVNLSVVSKNGLLTANFVTENQVTKEALESQMQILKDNFANQGIKVDSIEVTVSNFAFEQSNQSEDNGKQKKESSKRINIGELDFDNSILTEEEILAASILEQNGGSVDYTA